MNAVGVDACKKGWFAVCLGSDERWAIEIFDSIDKLWNAFLKDSLILIDIPIGLPGKGKRRCDVEARKILRKRAASVFPVPCRQAVYANTYAKACRLNKKVLDARLSIQTWNISRKIREVDNLLLSNAKARRCVRESHPEICFWALADGRPMMYYKKTAQGFSERIKLLNKSYPSSPEIVTAALTAYRRKDLARDDILDAMVLAITASAASEGIVTIPKHPEKDPKCLSMEIVYGKTDSF
jgi:predicted RNase H-like nuclease